MIESLNGLLKKLMDAQAATQGQLAELQQQIISSQETSSYAENQGGTWLYLQKERDEKQWRYNKVVDSHINNDLYELKKIPPPTNENTTTIK